MAYRLDKKDVEILKMLKKDSRTPMGLIGNKLEISKATVSRRVASMEEDGTITKYSLDIDHASIGMKECEKILAEEGLKGQIKTMIGGGATSKEFADQIGADGWSYDAVEASKVAAAFLGI